MLSFLEAGVYIVAGYAIARAVDSYRRYQKVKYGTSSVN